MNGKQTKHKESVLQTRIIKYLEAQGAVVVNPFTSRYSKKGTPDLLVCFLGFFIAIEVKAPGETPNELQLLRLERVRQAGGYAIWTDNIEDVKELINDISTIQLPCKSKR